MDPSSDHYASCLVGAEKVLSECLLLRSGDSLTIFFDETTEEPAKLLISAANKLRLSITTRRVEVNQQCNFSGDSELPIEDLKALGSARGILTCLSNQPAGTAYRRALLRQGTNAHQRVGHMPGIDLNLLAHAVNIDYFLASSMCDDLALSLTIGNQAKLRTYIYDEYMNVKDEFDLNFELGGTLRPAITSTGRIPIGTWGNLPGGETFIAPIENTAKGVFVLNGSFKNNVIRPPDAVLLYFSGGQLERVGGTGKMTEKFDEFLTNVGNRGGDSFNKLAEFGIGVNPGVPDLTGNALFDEKCLGTAHIAIGDSERYGGSNKSEIHEDLVTRSPSLWIDEKPILSKGQHVFTPNQWRETIAESPIEHELSSPNVFIKKTSMSCYRHEDGTFRIRRQVTAGRICDYSVGYHTTSILLALLYSFIPDIPRSISFSELCDIAKQKLSIPSKEVKSALSILYKHGAIFSVERSTMP